MIKKTRITDERQLICVFVLLAHDFYEILDINLMLARKELDV